jgi:large subunit ribosomal protein L18
VDKAVLYIGNKPFTSRIAACMKGIVQAGINIPISSESYPTEHRLNGQHIAEYALKIKREDINKYNKYFSSLLREGLVPESYQSHVEDITSLILKGELTRGIYNEKESNKRPTQGSRRVA